MRGVQTDTSQLFETMTDVEVQAWREYAATLPQKSNKTGLPIKKKAINAFCSLADRFLLMNPGGTVPRVPPTTNFKGDTIGIQCTASGGALLFTASAQNSSNIVTEILVQKLPSKNRVPQVRDYRSKTYKAFTGTGLTYTLPVTAGYYAAAYRFCNKATGQAGPLRPIPVVTVALSAVAEDEAAAPTPTPRAKKAA